MFRYRYDTETGLYYLQSRYYNPDWGRFINADALVGKTGDLLGHNMFAYCQNNCVNAYDPNGFQMLADDGGFGGYDPTTVIERMGEDLFDNAAEYGRQAGEDPYCRDVYMAAKDYGMTAIAKGPGLFLGLAMDVYDNHNNQPIAQVVTENFVTASNYRASSELLNTSARIDGINYLKDCIWDIATFSVQGKAPSSDWNNESHYLYNGHGRGFNE